MQLHEDSSTPPLEDERARQLAVEAADAELDEVVVRLSRQLQRDHPELFDRDGRLVPERLARKLRGRFGGKTTLTRDEILRLTDPQRDTRDGRRAADGR